MWQQSLNNKKNEIAIKKTQPVIKLNKPDIN